MKYMMFIKHSEHYRDLPFPPALGEAMGKFVADSFASGVLVETAGLKRSADSTRMRLKGGKLTVTDGPFTEAKEIVGGFAIVQVTSHEEALKVARDFMELHRIHWPEFEGESEIRPFEDMGEPQG